MTSEERTQLDAVWAEIRAVSAKVDILVERDQRDRGIIDDHEARLRGSERWRYSLPAAFLISIATAVSTILAAVLRG